jgi:hypothetical protein
MSGDFMIGAFKCVYTGEKTMAFNIPAFSFRELPPMGVLIRSAPSAQHEMCSHVSVWAQMIFNLDAAPYDFFEHIHFYCQFYTYINSKGIYTPDRYFLGMVLNQIQTNKFKVEELQQLESTFVDQFGFFNTMAFNIKKTLVFQKKSIEKYGCIVEMEVSQTQDVKPSEVPTLAALCHQALMKNGYPHAVTSWEKLKSIKPPT